MTVANFQVPESAQANSGIFRNVLNAILEALAAARPTYGAALPAIGTVPDGKLFSLTTTNKLYQARSGSWVLMT